MVGTRAPAFAEPAQIAAALPTLHPLPQIGRGQRFDMRPAHVERCAVRVSDSTVKQRGVVASLLAMTERHRSAFSRHDMPEFSLQRLPSTSKRAQGTPDAGRTREPCVQKKLRFAHASNDRAAGTTGVPCAMVYGLWRALPGVRAFLVTVAREISACRPAWADIANLADLIPASGDQDHTLLPSASPRLVCAQRRVHRSPHPTLMTSGAPLLWMRDGTP
jgi:hypothetical protein